MPNTKVGFLSWRLRLFLGFTLAFTVICGATGYWLYASFTQKAINPSNAVPSLVTALAVIYAGGLALIFLVSNAILAPIRQLLRAAQASDQNGATPSNFDRLTQPNFPDEIGALAHIFRERQQALAAKREGEQKLYSLLEHSGDGITLVDETGRIVEWNPGMEVITGVARAEALGRPAWDIQALMRPGADHNQLAQAAAAVFREGRLPAKPAPYEWLMRQPSTGELRVIEENPFVVPIDARFMIGSISRDITGRKTAEKQIQELNADLEQRVRARTRELEETVQELRREVAERQRAEAALRESEARYRNLVDISPDAIILTDLAGHALMANPQARTLFGYAPAADPPGEDTFDFIAPPDRERACADLQQALTSQRLATVEYTLQRRDGTQFMGELSASPVADDAGEPRRFIGIVRDTTGRRQAEAMLQRRQATLELLNRAGQAFNSTLELDQVLTTVLDEVRRGLDAIVCSIWLTDPATGEIVCRQATGPQNDLVRGWRLPPGQGIAGWVIGHGEALNLADAQTDLRHYTGVDQKTQLPLRSLLAVPLHGKRGTVGVIEVGNTQVSHFKNEDLAFLELLAFTAVTAVENAGLYEQAQQEIARRKRAEETLSSANQRLQALSRQLVEVQETERRQLALELHDELGQMLNSIKLSLDLMPTDPAAESEEPLRRAKRLISQLIQQVRQLALDLRPAMLDDLGLVPALKSFFRRQTTQTGLQVNFENGVADNRRFPTSIETAAYRIIQEGVTNATRHAHIRSLSVELQADDLTLTLRVCDQGTGFDPAARLAQPTSTGLTGMRERARLLGGDLAIESAPGAGARLCATLPLT